MHPEALGENPVLRATDVPKVSLVEGHSAAGILPVAAARDAWLRQALDWFRARGRRRIAWLGIPNTMPPAMRQFHAAAAAQGLETRAGWTHAVHPRYPNWAANAMDAVFGSAAAVRPDALLITDDHLADHATGALARLPLRIPQDLDIVCLNNFPLPLTTHVPVRQLGFDARETIAACLDVLGRVRTGTRVPAVVRIEARFGDEPSVPAPAVVHSAKRHSAGVAAFPGKGVRA